jgi:hypothetical protein
VATYWTYRMYRERARKDCELPTQCGVFEPARVLPPLADMELRVISARLINSGLINRIDRSVAGGEWSFDPPVSFHSLARSAAATFLRRRSTKDTTSRA